MPDQYDDVMKQLEEMGVGKQWHVVEPKRGEHHLDTKRTGKISR
jgi:hypothetical protein